MSAAREFDVIVVGARCAGAPLAAMLARAGLDVCVLDRDRFPSDTASTHGIQPAGVQVLERLGVLDDLFELAPPVTRLRIVFDDAEVPVADVVAITGAPGLKVRRAALDEVLLGAAVAAGAEVRTETAVTGLAWSEGRVVGVETASERLRARLVVGADGVRSAVAGMVGATEYQRTANGRVFMWAYYEGAPTDGEMWIGKLGDHTYLATPTDGGLSLVGACPSIDRRDAVRADREGAFETALRAWPELEARLAGSSREGRVRTMAKMPGFFRPAAGPGWALVGDAGHFKDPTPGQGIADALRQAERLSAAIVEGFDGGGTSPDAALREWWRWRDEDAWEMYWFAHDMGAAGPTPDLLREAQRRIADDPGLGESMVRLLNHDLRPSQAFDAAFAMGTLAQALRNRKGRRGAVLRDAGITVADEVGRLARRAYARRTVSRSSRPTRR